MNMPERRDGAARIMTTNFPQSRYLKVGDVRPDVPWWRIWDPDW
jgi:outer membrane protein assembly factor BamD